MVHVRAPAIEFPPHRFAGPLLAAVFVLASALLFLLSTRHGIGILPDSVAYMQLGGLRHNAPLYMWLLQATTWVGLDIVDGAKWLGLFFISLNCLLVWQLLLLATRSISASAIGTALIVFSPVYVGFHVVAMSEPLFISLVLTSLFLSALFFQEQQRAWLVPIGLVGGIAMLARFSAAPLFAAFAVCRLLYPGKPMKERVIDCTIMGASGALVFSAWAIASKLATGVSTGRDLALYGNPDAARWLSGLRSLSATLLPVQVPGAIRYALVLVLVAILASAAVAYSRRLFSGAARGAVFRYAALPSLCALFILFYLGFLVLSVLIEANLNLNTRYLLPIYIIAVLMITIIAGAQMTPLRLSKPVRYVLAAAAAVILLGHGARTSLDISAAFTQGIGYAERSWSTSPLLRQVDALPQDAIIYSNGPDVIAYASGRAAEWLPAHVERRTGVEDPRNQFESQMASVRHSLEQGNGFVVIFDKVTWRFYLASEAELTAQLGLELMASAADGRLYGGQASQVSPPMADREALADGQSRHAGPLQP